MSPTSAGAPGDPAPHTGEAPRADALPAWPAWVAAGTCFLVAGYLVVTAGVWGRYAQLLEAEVSGPASLVLRAPHGAPLGLVLLGLMVLALGARGARHGAPRGTTYLAPVAATLVACWLGTSHAVLFRRLAIGIHADEAGQQSR